MRRRILACLFCLTAAMPAAAQDRACFARALPAEIRDHRLDDVKLLIGWVFDSAAANRLPQTGAVIDRHATLAVVPGFADATPLNALAGRYRVMRTPFNDGHGYFGIELGALDADGRVSSLYLVNRLFRLPILLQQPLGVLTDIVTNGAMLGGWNTRAIIDANAAARAVLGDAEELHVPLLTAGQSQAGGVAQLQAATVVTLHPAIVTGFISLNAAPVAASIRRLKLTPGQVGGINFSKDLDPAFGPHGVLPNSVGLQVFVHPDGTAGAVAGKQGFLAALWHPSQHLLASFDGISLAAALSGALKDVPEHCVAVP